MTYFEKHALHPPLIPRAPEPDLALVVTIPCHDEPDLPGTLASLAACVPPPKPVEVLVLINSAGNAGDAVKKRNADTLQQAKTWAKAHPSRNLRFYFLHFPDLPPKHAGVGLARKIAMDEAARRLVQTGNARGVIACLDADSQVAPNYLQALLAFFEQYPDCPAAGIYYEHPLEGEAFEPEVYAAIARYELHLRYYVQALRWAGLPTATQTVGSAMAVRANAYQAQGGMNRRQAGEDFYFLHKFTPLAGFSEITTTTVIPSPRMSHRVPFGTGKAVGEMLSGNAFLTYAPQTFNDLKVFLENLDRWQSVGLTLSQADTGVNLPPSISTFLETERFPEKLREICANTASPEAFRKRFFRWFDPFLAMKYVHHARDHFYPNVPVEEAVVLIGEYGLRIADWALQSENIQLPASAQKWLLLFRQSDKHRKPNNP
ncbi:MAG: glycosyltransferase [Saprospiraceae bacterium]|nr:glycosyltransferase [Lewinellaceae bacterium]